MIKNMGLDSLDEVEVVNAILDVLDLSLYECVAWWEDILRYAEVEPLQSPPLTRLLVSLIYR